MISINLDNTNKTASIKVNLKGEEHPINVNIDRYKTSNKGTPMLSIEATSCDRPWIDALLKNFAQGKSLPLPERVSDYLKLADDILC